MNKFQLLGTKRGTVLDNADPLKLGRLKIAVPEAYGNQSANTIPWAYPKFPNSESFYIPRKGDQVYVEFFVNDGVPDPSQPMWKGAWLGKGESPEEIKKDSPQNSQYYKVFQTPKHKIVTCDKPGEEYILLRHSSGSFIKFEENGDIIIQAKGNVYIN